MNTLKAVLGGVVLVAIQAWPGAMVNASAEDGYVPEADKTFYEVTFPKSRPGCLLAGYMTLMELGVSRPVIYTVAVQAEKMSGGPSLIAISASLASIDNRGEISQKPFRIKSFSIQSAAGEDIVRVANARKIPGGDGVYGVEISASAALQLVQSHAEKKRLLFQIITSNREMPTQFTVTPELVGVDKIFIAKCLESLR